MKTPPGFSIRARAASFSHALRGLWFMIQSQHNAWLHAIATVVVIVVSDFKNGMVLDHSVDNGRLDC